MVIRALMLLVAAAQTAVVADDWPQWMGPERNNVWYESGIVRKFPDGGPKILWRTPIAGGFAGPAVADGKVFVTDYVIDTVAPMNECRTAKSKSVSPS
ncbi:MAG: PQQ-binding-like beta-propeller repeat protein, partial [Fuerstiella sp.]|nr:PQQ-binding-like beta-propeller repeat protein [Fuerstiella sp.]